MNIMLTIGGFQFSIGTAAYQELTRITEYRWPSQERFMQGQALQFVGPGGDTIALPGVIYPEHNGGTMQLENLRALASSGLPQTLIDGRGNVMGDWAIEKIDEKQSIFAQAGVARKQEFTLNIRKFSDSVTGPQLNVADFNAGQFATALPPTVAAQAGVLMQSTENKSSGFSAALSSALSSANSVASDFGALASSVLTPITRAINIANGLKNSAHDAKGLLGSIPTAFSSASSLTALVNAANGAVANSTQAGSAINTAFGSLSGLGSVPSASLKIVSDANITINKLTVMSTNTQSNASLLLSKVL